MLLVDADPLGGGLDVLLGIEDAPGVRWPDLVETRGRLGAASLAEALPHVAGVALLSWGRDGATSLAAEAMSAVLDAGERGHDLVIVDLPRQLDPAGELVLARADETVLVTTNRVRSTAAAARIAGLLQCGCASVGLALRTEAKGVRDDAVLAALSLPIAPASACTRAGRSGRRRRATALRDAYGRACHGRAAHDGATLGRVA